MVTEIVISLVSGAFAVLAALTAFIVSRKQKLQRKEENERQKELSEALRVSFSKSFQDYFTKYDSQLINADKTNYIISNYRDFLVHYPRLETKADIEEQVNEKVNELKKRIEAIEARFPPEAKLEKIASVNDAILATQLEAMSDSIKAIQDKMLTKWDVAKVVFAILGSLGAIVAIIFGILTWVKP